ncbi:MAG: metallophosphoesterase [Tannerellaceae bacterium]|jgi:predicted MPP superfamily phosphohydrolase|nr:metallophosphoesterase [Tannerellaceae bacterium]
MNHVLKHIKAYAFCLFFLAGLPVGCEKDNHNPDAEILLRSLRNDSSPYYELNNSYATRRLASIMYNRADTLHPVERFKLVHISDPHLSAWSIGNHYAHPNNLIESVTFANQRELRINAMVETGDHIGSTNLAAARLSMSAFFHFLYQDNNVPTFSCYGNHDSNITSETKWESDHLFSSELALAVRGHTNHTLHTPEDNKSYYYADVPNPQGGVVRFIALDMLDQPGAEYNTLHYVIFSQEQIDWLGNVALREGMTEGHSVIILTHFPLQRSIWGGMSKATGLSSYLCDGDYVHSWGMIPHIIEAFRTRSPINKTYPNKLHPEREGIRAAFDFSNASGEFICYLGGHAHSFALFDVDAGSSFLPPQKMILCTNQAPSEIGILYNRVQRAENSITSNSFHIYAIDTNEKKVYLTFFGAYIPSDEPDFPEIIEFPYL